MSSDQKAGEELLPGIHLNKQKTDMAKIYTNEKPYLYFDYLSKLNYSKSHNGFCKFFKRFTGSYLSEMHSSSEQVKVVDVACSYGNTTLGIVADFTWKELGEFWKNENEKLKKKARFDVTAFDISANALRYGLSRGYFDHIYVGNFNHQYSEGLKKKIQEADILCVYMAITYFEGNNFQKLVDLFLTDRQKDKFIFWEFPPAFQKDGLMRYLPDKVMSGHMGWYYDIHFCMHRLFTEEEKSKFNYPDTIGNESWSFVFGVKCQKMTHTKL